MCYSPVVAPTGPVTGNTLMSNEAAKLYTAAVRIAARLDTLFTAGIPAKWRVRISEDVNNSTSRKWGAFAVKTPDSLHAKLLKEVTGLDELRKAIRKAKRLASKCGDAQNTQLLFRELLKELIHTEWLKTTWVYDERGSYSDDGTVLEHLEFHVSHSGVALANRLVNEMRTVINEEDQAKARMATADSIFREKFESGMTSDKAEAEAKKESGVKYAPGSLYKRYQRSLEKNSQPKDLQKKHLQSHPRRKAA